MLYNINMRRKLFPCQRHKVIRMAYVARQFQKHIRIVKFLVWRAYKIGVKMLPLFLIWVFAWLKTRPLYFSSIANLLLVFDVRIVFKILNCRNHVWQQSDEFISTVNFLISQNWSGQASFVVSGCHEIFCSSLRCGLGLFIFKDV